MDTAMIDYKTPKEIEIMKKGGRILHDVLAEVVKHVKPGVSELEINDLAEKLIREKGGEPGFQRVRGWKHAVCMSTNDVVVHGIPTNYRFKDGDVVGVDCGVFLEGFNTDMSESVYVKSQKSNFKDEDEIDIFLKTGKKALDEAIKVAKVGNRIGHISKTIQDIVEKQGGYSIVRSLIGHGVGRELHEEPEVPGYLLQKLEKTPLLKEGMTIAVEVIYNMGSPDVMIDADGWTIRTQDGGIAGLYERTIAITSKGPMILT
jgi:methionyl aminopeptidase